MRTNSLFDGVNSRIALMPSPQGLWDSERSRRIRTHFVDRAIPAYVNGMHGNVTVSLQPDSFAITTER